MTRAVVDTTAVPERVVEICRGLGDGGVVGQAERAVPLLAAGESEIEEAAERFVAEP